MATIKLFCDGWVPSVRHEQQVQIILYETGSLSTRPGTRRSSDNPIKTVWVPTPQALPLQNEIQ